jgi:hypothetical protein
MLWYYNLKSNNDINSINSINFFQVFIENKLVYGDKDSNLIYSFDDSSDLSNLNLDLNKNNKENIISEIKIIDHLISYEINNINYVFISKSNFIKPEENKLNLPVFSHTYKLTSTKRLPNLIESEYNSVLTLHFQIYKLDNENKIQFIIETNPITNSIRKYFVTTNLNLIQPFITHSNN